MGMLIAVFVLLVLTVFGGGFGLWIGLMAVVLGVGISLAQPALSYARSAENREAAAETGTRPGPGCPCAKCQDALWIYPTTGDNQHWTVIDSPEDGRRTQRLSSSPAGAAGGGKTGRLPQNLNGHPRGCGCLDCGDLRAGKSARWA